MSLVVASVMTFVMFIVALSYNTETFLAVFNSVMIWIFLPKGL